MSELTKLTIAEARARLRAKEITAAELTDAYLAAMQDEGRRRLLLIDAPAVLEREKLERINARFGLRTLVEGVSAAMAAGAIRELPIVPLAQLLDALFDRAALAPADELRDYRKTIKALIRGLKT